MRRMAFCVIGLVFALAFAPLVAAASGPSVLSTNQSLGTNQYLRSANGRYRLVAQTDGNLVLYDQGKPIFATKTRDASSSGVFLKMQSDGNLVLYSNTRTVLFASRTARSGDSGYRLVVQDDGNVVIYDGAGRAIWSTHTSGR